MASTVTSQRYFCHQCNRTVTLTPSPDSDLTCPTCQGGFIEEFDLPDSSNHPTLTHPTPTPFLSFSSSSSSPTPDPLSSLFLASLSSPATTTISTTFDLHRPTDILSVLGFDAHPTRSRNLSSSSAAGGDDGPEPFNPFDFLRTYMQTLTDEGANIQFIVDGAQRFPASSSAGTGTGAATFGDYFVGPGLEQLIQHLMDNDPNRYGTPPASNSAVQSLPDVKISEELLASDDAQCAVCKDTFEIGDYAKQMPCKHIYHKDCILPWLELHNSCPVCRYELPTDDRDYEQLRGSTTQTASRQVVHRGTGGNGSGSAPSASAAGEEGRTSQPSGPRLVERRLRISLPWPFRSSSVSQSEGNNTGGAAGSGEGDPGGNGSSGGRGNTEIGNDTRQEGLD